VLFPLTPQESGQAKPFTQGIQEAAISKRQKPGAWLLDIFRDCGVDTNQLLRQLPEETNQLLKNPDRISTDIVNSILNACEALSGDAHFGLHLVRHIEISMYGTFGYLLLNAHTVKEFLYFAEHYYPLFYREARVCVLTHEDSSRFEYRRIDTPEVSPLHDNEWTIGFFVHFLRTKLGTDWQPLKATFSHPAPADTGELESCFGKNLMFDYPYCSFEIESSLLDVVITESDPGLLDILKGHSDLLLENYAARENFESQVRLLILQLVSEGSPSAKDVAIQMNMSLSTFKRRLAKRNLSFRILRDDVIQVLAQKVLEETDLSIAMVAQKMGYSETSSFGRAFRRHSGMTPRQYRQSVGE